MISASHRLYIVAALNLFIELCKPPGDFFHEISLTFRRMHVIILLQNLQTEHESIPRLADPLFKSLGSQILDKLIRIFIGLHPNDPGCDAHIPQYRDSPKRCLGAGFVAVICKIDFLHIPLDQRCMSRRKRRSQGSDRIGESRLVKGYHIHISFTEKEIGLLGTPRPVQSVEVTALVEYHGLRRVQVFGLSISHNTAAKAYDAAVGIHDREHDPVPELVVSPLPFIYGNQSGLCDHLILISFGTKIFVEVIAVLVGIS